MKIICFWEVEIAMKIKWELRKLPPPQKKNKTKHIFIMYL